MQKRCMENEVGEEVDDPQELYYEAYISQPFYYLYPSEQKGKSEEERNAIAVPDENVPSAGVGK